MGDLIFECEKIKSICLYRLYPVGDCLCVTDSGKRKRYLIGRLDNGEPFIERSTILEETR